MPWTNNPSVPVAGAVISAAGWGAVVADAITELHTAADGLQTGKLDATAQAVDTAKIQTRAVSASAPTTNQVLTWDGSAWGPATFTTATATLHQQTFTSSGTWTCPTGVTYVEAILVAGGGATNGMAGGGGGEVKRAWLSVTSGTAYTVTIGAGGSSGGAGGSSSFGGLLSCTGGAGPASPFSGGTSGNGNKGGQTPYNGGAYSPGGGGGGAGGPGQFGAITGVTTGTWSATTIGGNGGPGMYGYGGGGGGWSGDYPGSGSCGGGNQNSNGAANTGGGAGGTNATGKTGGSGICIVTWWT